LVGQVIAKKEGVDGRVKPGHDEFLMDQPQ